MTDCIETTSDLVVEDGTLPDQLRLRPRLYRFSPFRRRISPTPNADGTPYYDDAGLDLRLVGEAYGDQVAPTTSPAPTDADGELARNGLSRRLVDGVVGLYGEPANDHKSAFATVIGVTGISGPAGSAGYSIELATVSIEYETGPFPVLVRPIYQISNLRIGHATKTFDLTDETIEVPYLPAVVYSIVGTGVVEKEDPVSLSVNLGVGVGGSAHAQAFRIPARSKAEFEAKGSLVYTGDNDSFPILNSGRLSLFWEIVELTAQD